MTRPRIVHVLQALTRGGAARAMIAAAKYSARQASFQHEVISLRPAEAAAIELAHEANMVVYDQPAPQQVQDKLAAAEIVQLHFWNTPELFELLQTPLPAMRLLIWVQIAGDQAPQVVTKELFQFADTILAGCRYTAELPIFKQMANAPGAANSDLVWIGADFQRLDGLKTQAHESFNVGYIGTVDFVKMHPAYVAMAARVQAPNVRFLVYGSGGGFATLRRQAAALGIAERFELGGYLEDIRSVLQRLDIFGYPLCQETYACAESVLQEAMVAGVPPVIFAHGGAQQMVEHGKTGLVVHSEAEYVEAIEYLYNRPDERRQMARHARDHARRVFGAENSARRLNQVYNQMLLAPKRLRCWPTLATGSGRASGASLFVQALGQSAQPFQISLTASDPDELLAAETTIRQAPPVLISAGGGGILHYRAAFPQDGHLRLWSGLALLQQARPALALAEFAQAKRLGLDHWRLAWYLALAAQQANARELARQALAEVIDQAPEFTPARALMAELEPVPGDPGESSR